MTTTRTTLGLGGFVLTVVVANWLVGPIALIVAWLIVVAVLVVAAAASPTPRTRWVLVMAVILLVGLPVAAIIEFAAGPSALQVIS